jgi:hypothetical protein
MRTPSNRVLRRIFGPRRDEVTADWRKLHSEELHDMYTSQTIITRIVKSMRMRWAGNITRIKRRRMNIEFWKDILKERDH